MENKFLHSFLIVILTIGLMVSMFLVGYYKRANDIGDRINNADNNTEECFTREEVDSFIYGK